MERADVPKNNSLLASTDAHACLDQVKEFACRVKPKPFVLVGTNSSGSSLTSRAHIIIIQYANNWSF